MSAIGVDPKDHRHVLVGNAGIVASRDGGASWTTVMRAPPVGAYEEVRAIAFDSRNPLVVFAASAPGRLARSSDGGTSWRPVASGFPGEWVFSLAVDPVRAGVVYAGGARGLVASSTDGGVSWRSRSIPGVGTKNVQSLAVAPSEPGTLYAAIEVGVARSTDSGESWRLVKVRGLDCVAVAVDPVRADTVYVGTDAGVLRSTDRGVTWKPFGQRLPSRSISTLAFNATGTVLYAGTNGAGLTSIRVR